MREIKFRAWDNYRKEMCYEVDVYCETDRTWWAGQWRAKNGDKIECFTNEGGVLMQYTGLKDKNGTWLYDKSIIKLGDTVYLIIWCDKCASFSIVDVWGDYFSGEYTCENCEGLGLHWLDFIYELDDVEEIGNLFENPDLLET
jgi:uncharacterized phage protein (TIGR01671 family)